MAEPLEIPKEVNLPQIEETETPAKVNAIWPPEIQSLVDWFCNFIPPEAPFYLEPHRHVIAPEKFFALLRVELKAGPTGPRARMGTLQDDLQRLKTHFGYLA